MDLCLNLYCKPCNTVGVRVEQNDILCNSGTMSGVLDKMEMEILKNIAEEDVLIKTVTGVKLVSKLYGDIIFGKSKILNGHCGFLIVSQHIMSDMRQIINQDEYAFNL